MLNEKSPIVNVSNLTVAYRNSSRDSKTTPVLNNVSLSLKKGEVHVLLGQSGSGKSTLLRALSGFHQPVLGKITIDGVVVSCQTGSKGDFVFVSPDKRRIGFVFQDYALFPHMSLFRNVMYGANGDVEYVNELISMIGLSEKKERRPDQLSGGERQRVALARAMAMKPKLLLLDEPFSNLDPTLRYELRQRTLDIIREANLTTILVTHSPEEAMAVADSISVLSKGDILQSDTPSYLYYCPNSLMIAKALGPINQFSATFTDDVFESILPLCSDAQITGFSIPDDLLNANPAIRRKGYFLVRPGEISIERGDDSEANAELSSKVFLGDFQRVECMVGGKLVVLVCPSTEEIYEQMRLSIRRAHWIDEAAYTRL